jgi:hypothetical protein
MSRSLCRISEAGKSDSRLKLPDQETRSGMGRFPLREWLAGTKCADEVRAHPRCQISARRTTRSGAAGYSSTAGPPDDIFGARQPDSLLNPPAWR